MVIIFVRVDEMRLSDKNYLWVLVRPIPVII